jgi:hypothetical protein
MGYTSDHKYIKLLKKLIKAGKIWTTFL